MLTNYHCKVEHFSTTNKAIRYIINKVKKEWKIVEIIEKSADYSSQIIYEFDEGEQICFFVEDDGQIFYCGPINVRREKLSTFTLWVFDFCFYIDKQYHIIKDVSYIWDTLSSKKMPNDLIYNPCIILELDNTFEIAKPKEIYKLSQLKDLYLVDMCPNSDNILNRKYQLKFYKNTCVNHIVSDVEDFEISLLNPRKIIYKYSCNDYYLEYDIINNQEVEVFYIQSEADYRIQEEYDFWKLISIMNNTELTYSVAMDNKQIKLFKKRVSIETNTALEFYFCASNSMSEIIIENYFAKHAVVKRLPQMFEADFSHNYKMEIAVSNTELLYIWLYFVKEKMVKIPCICGVEVAKIINYFRGRKLIDDKTLNYVIPLIQKGISRKQGKIIESFMQAFPYRVLLSMQIDCLTYKGKKEIYTYLYNNLNDFHSKYISIIHELEVVGKISPRWKSEFSLYMLVKSYYPNAIYQYHSEWLQKQSLDIFIPDIDTAIEYQGQQHYEPIEIFGGAKGLAETRKRDKMKREKCKTNGVFLIEWSYLTEITDSNFMKKFEENNIDIPVKRYADFKMNKIENTTKGNSEIICQYNLIGTLVAEYESITQASEKSGIKDYLIRRACSGIRDSAGGYQWKKFNPQNKLNAIQPLEKKKSSGEARCIIQLDQDNIPLGEYSSIAEAVRVTGINSKSIRDAANGKQKHAGGYWIFRLDSAYFSENQST